MHIHDKLCSKLRLKRRLRVQDRPAGCVLSRTYPSQQQKVPQVRLRKLGHTVTGYPKQKEIRAGPDSGSPVSRNPFTSGLRGSFPSRVQSLGDSCICTPSILPPSTNLFSSVPAYGVTQLGLRSYPSGSFVPETPSTSFSLGLTDHFMPPRRSDPLVLANLLQHWQDLRFLTSGIPIRTFQVDFTIFTDASTQGWGAHMGDSQISGTWTRTDRKLHIICLELKAVICALQH